MRDVINCIEKYMEAIENENFIIHWKKLASKLIAGIRGEYEKRSHEPSIVKLIRNIINSIGQFKTEDKKLSITTKSVFIHGNKSKVEFEFHGNKTKRELGDIIFVLSVVYNSKKYFEKITITQFKKSSKASWDLRSDSTKEQLYLLSRFPTFRGADKSLIPKKDYNLPNYSKCLGTHGLLYYPGDFAIISSNLLECILSNRKRLNLEDLLLYYRFVSNYRTYLDDIFDLIYLLYGFRYFRFPFLSLPLLGNSCIAYNSYEFSDKYLRGLIGEMIYARNIPYNRPALLFLQDLLLAIKRKAQKENQKDILEFVYSFFQYAYADGQGREGFDEFDYEGGGIGIVHTTINLGESK